MNALNICFIFQWLAYHSLTVKTRQKPQTIGFEPVLPGENRDRLCVRLKTVKNCRLIFGRPMEIVNFFEKMAGRWLSQRTTHALSTQQSKAGKSDLEVEFLASDTDDLKQIYQAQGGAAPLSQPLCGLRIQQSSTIEGDSKANVETTMLVILTPKAQDDGTYTGTLLRSGATNKSTYVIEDEVLTITNSSEEANSTERLWFINDNLRMRTGVTELKSGLRIASFCSEIRMGVKPPSAAN